MSTPKARLCCAVYTRKSTEEGLEQEFNSLDAQREACAAYIASQAGVGWTLVRDVYDDGGVSGGTMDRPALKRLLTDIEARRVDVVVVYKIDRLTRSLTDFARIVEVFDKHGVSFVSVTQQFNTTTSMGRLTLNVLLSFAQFEREVTAERIRDKIAASKRKGMWMGGVVPLGYRVEERKLVIEESEARIVRHLFQRYIELRSVPKLVDEARTLVLPQLRLRKPGKPFGRGNLYHLLSNPIYAGKIRHKDALYEGEHQQIIAQELFDQVQAMLADQAQDRAAPKNRAGAHLLTGLLFDDTDDRMSPTHANKKGVRYRYYISSRLMDRTRRDDTGWRLPASEIEALVLDQTYRVLHDHAMLARWLEEAGLADSLHVCLENAKGIGAGRDSETAGMPPGAGLRSMVRRIALHRDRVEIDIDRHSTLLMLGAKLGDGDPLAFQTIILPVTLRRRGAETRLVMLAGQPIARHPDESLVHLIARAHAFLASLTEMAGRTLGDVAKLHGTDLSSVSRILPYAFLSPALTEAILTGRQSPTLNTQRLLRLADVPIDWSQQQALLA